MMTFTKPHIRLVLVIVLAGGVMLGGTIGQAQAGDRKIFNSALCQPQRGNMNTTQFDYYRGTIRNNDKKKYLIVECPVTRDSTSKGVKEWGFSGLNRNPNAEGESFKCTMSSRAYPTGQVLDSQLGFLKYKGRVRVNITKGPKKYGMTYLSLTCTIPPDAGQASRLGSYFVEEH